MKKIFQQARALRQRKEESKTPAQQRRKLLIELIFKSIFFFMGAAALVFTFINIVLGSSVFIPRDSQGILDSVKEPQTYGWISEDIRRLDLYGWKNSSPFIAWRGVSLNLAKNQFQADTFGVLPVKTQFISDGQRAIAKPLNKSGRIQGELLHDYCAQEGNPVTETATDDDVPSAKLLAFPSAEEIAASSPRLATDEATWNGKRAWAIDFDPSPEIIRQILWIPFFESIKDSPPIEKDSAWTLSSKELSAIDSGRYSVKSASALIGRDSRELGQLEIWIVIDLGKQRTSEYRILAQKIPRSEEELRELYRDLSIEKGISCG